MPDSQRIKVSFGAMETLAADIRGQVSAIEGNIADLGQQIRNLENDWEGGASAGFQATKAKWFDAAENLKMVLARIETAVVQSTEGYNAAETKNAARWE
jgi:early secretory antigenic target protein ESAT-6